MRTPTLRRSHAPDGAAQHRGWLELIEISGPFLSLPVLRRTWPTLDALEKPTRDALRREHTAWRDDPDEGCERWVEWVLTGLLGWGDDLRQSADELDVFALDVPEHDARVVPTFALVEPDEDVKPATTRLLGLVCPAGHSPTARVPGSPWAATYADRLAAVCRHHGVELGLVTDGRWWALVWAPKDKATGVAVVDTIAWPEAAERDVVRAFVSILGRVRFFGVPDGERLPALLSESLGSQEEITEALGSQVREAVELLVAALGRQDIVAQERGLPSLEMVDAHEVYRGAVSVMMRIVFLLFAEERRLLPADNDLYASTYSAGTLLQDLEERVAEGSEDDLEHTTVAWHRLLAVFAAVHGGIEHPRLTMHAHDGSLFDPDNYPWLDMPVDDRTVLHMLRAVQTVQIGTGRLKERRTLSFRSLGVEEIGYVYEGLLAYDAFRAVDVVVGLVGKRGSEPEVELRELEHIASFHHDTTTLGAELSSKFKDSGLGTGPAIARKMKPLTGAAVEEARRKLLAAAQGDARLADRLMPFFGLLRQDLRELPMVIAPGALYVTDSPRRRNTGTHYTPRELAEEVVLHALEPLVYEPGPLQTAETGEWKLKTAEEILALNVADIAMGSAAFLVAAARYLGARLIEAWTREGDERALAYSISDVKSDEDPVVIEARRQVIEHCLYGVDINPMAVEMAKLSLWLVSMDPVRPFTFLDDRLIEGDSLLGIVSLDQVRAMALGRTPTHDYAENDLLGWTVQLEESARQAAAARTAIVEVQGDAATLDGKRASLLEAWESLRRIAVSADLLIGASLADRSGQGTERLQAMQIASALASGQGKEREALEISRKWLATDLPERAFGRCTVHWPLVFPEVFINGGFDAIVSNPPYLGGKLISGPFGSAYREHLVKDVAGGKRGNVDLIGYFTLRVASLLRGDGSFGIIGTSSLGEGETRDGALETLREDGFTIRRCIRSAIWPTKAKLEYCAIWSTRSALEDSAVRIADGKVVRGITTSLKPESRVLGLPLPLKSVPLVASQGSIVLGNGFRLTLREAEDVISDDERNSAVVKSYLSGDTLNSASDLRADEAVVDFGNRDETSARRWALPWGIVEQRVKPERMLKDAEKYPSMVSEWWKHWNRREKLYRLIEPLSRVIALTRVSNTQSATFVDSNQVFNDQVVVFASDDAAILAFLNSSIHYWWTVERTATRGVGAAPRYAPSDVLATLPFPVDIASLRNLGEELDQHRRGVMCNRGLGLTAIHNCVSDATCEEPDIVRLRNIYKAIDIETVELFGWSNRVAAVGGLGHGFQKLGKNARFTIGSAARRELLDSLLELNHERYAEEVAQGLHDKKKGGRAKKAPEQEGMFDAE